MREFKFLKQNKFPNTRMLAERFAHQVFREIIDGGHNQTLRFPVRQFHHEIGVFQIDSIQREIQFNQPISIFCNVKFQDINETLMPTTYNIQWYERI